MAYPRKRDDSSSTVYQINNALVGETGEIVLGLREIKRLSLIIRQADRLFSVTILSFHITSYGYSLVCSAPAGLPSRADLRCQYTHRYGDRREMPDFDDPDVYDRWAHRLRDFSCLIKDIQQRFTQWYNQVIRGGRRRGTLWKSRFQSHIVKTAGRLLTAVRTSLGKKPFLRKLQGQRWRKTRKGCGFIRDVTVPALSASLSIPCMLVDVLGGIPHSPFPLKILREMAGGWRQDDH